MRTVEWDYAHHNVRLIDQRCLPGDFRVVTLESHLQVANAIREMIVRGAPAIGAAAAFGLALAAQESTAQDLQAFIEDLELAAAELEQSRPTAVNLTWAIWRVLKVVKSLAGANIDIGDVLALREATLAEAQKIADEDVEQNKKMAVFGASLIDDGDVIIHHCNTGALATVDWGTALGVIHTAHLQGKCLHVLVDETRPRLQGARLTAWELDQYGIPYDIITDNAAGYFLKAGMVNKVFVGADRVAANGDVVNKIGTYMLALAAFDNEVPFYSVVPTTTIDLSLASGDQIPIEERSESEVLNLSIDGSRVTPVDATGRNPAFDMTPNRLITAIVTNAGIAFPPYEESLKQVVAGINSDHPENS